MASKKLEDKHKELLDSMKDIAREMHAAMLTTGICTCVDGVDSCWMCHIWEVATKAIAKVDKRV